MMYKEVEYYQKDNHLYLYGFRRENKHKNWITFFLKFKINGDGYKIFRDMINDCMRIAKRNSNLIQEYLDCKEYQKKHVSNKNRHKDCYKNIRYDYENNNLTLIELKKKYGGSIAGLQSLVKYQTYNY